MTTIKNNSIPFALADALERTSLARRGYAAVTVYHRVWVNYGEALVGVFGDGANGCYEWFIWNEAESKLRTSAFEYGNDCAALCCGLVESGSVMANGDHDLRLTWTREPHPNATVTK